MALWADLYGCQVQHTDVAVADAIAAAAGLLMGQAAKGLRGCWCAAYLLPGVNGTGNHLVRPEEMDLYR